ncbi:MAG: hypothetical protein AAB929_00095 [Patescibacteria group bacterium]
MANGENIHQIAKGILRDYGLKQIDTLCPGETQDRGIASFIRSKLSTPDISGVIDLVCIGMAAAVENKSYGKAILAQTDEYLHTSHYTQEPILKSITPHTTRQNEKPDHHHLQKLRKKLMDVRKLNGLLTEEKRREIFEEDRQAVLQFVEYIGTQQSEMETDVKGMWSLLQANPYGVQVKPETVPFILPDISIKTQLKHKAQILDYILHSAGGNTYGEIVRQRGHLPDGIIKEMKKTVYWTMQYGGISISQILGKTDPKEQKKLFLTYAKHIPRGDIFWHLVVNRSLFGQFALVDEEGLSLKDPVVVSLLRLQHSLASDLFFTPEGEGNQSEDIIEVISRFDLPLGEKLSSLESSFFFYEFSTNKDEIGAGFLNEALLEEFFSDKGGHSPSLLIDEVVDWYIKKHNTFILERLIRTAQTDREKIQLKEWFAKKISTPYAEGHTKEAIESLRNLMGDSLWHMIEGENHQDTVEVTKSIIDSILRDNLWPTDTIHRIDTFEKGSLPYMLGIDAIRFALDADYPDIMTGSIDLRYPRKISIISNIRKNGKDIHIDFSIDPSANGEITDVLRLIVAVELRDHLLDMKESGEEVHEVAVSSNEVTARLNYRAQRLSNGEFKPRTVSCHARRLTGSKAFDEAVMEYNKFTSEHMDEQLTSENNAERDNLLAEVVRTRKAMNNINERKMKLVETLPEKIQNDMVIRTDPQTGKAVYLSTWVIAHKSPKPDSGEATDLHSYFNSYVRDTNGPMSATYNPLIVALSEESEE